MLITEGDVLAFPQDTFFSLLGVTTIFTGGTCPLHPPPLNTLPKKQPFEGVRGHAARKFFAKFHIKTRIFVHSRGTFEVMLAGSPSPHPSLCP